MNTIVLNAVYGGVGGLVKTIEKVPDLKKETKKIEWMKVFRNLIYGGVGGLMAAETGVTNITMLIVSGYFGEKVLRKLIQSAQVAFKK